jgi:hypothetical protein
MLLKMFSMSTYIMAQSRCNQGVGQRGLECQKGWPHILQESKLQTSVEIGALEMTLK